MKSKKMINIWEEVKAIFYFNYFIEIKVIVKQN